LRKRKGRYIIIGEKDIVGRCPKVTLLTGDNPVTKSLERKLAHQDWGRRLTVTYWKEWLLVRVQLVLPKHRTIAQWQSA